MKNQFKFIYYLAFILVGAIISAFSTDTVEKVTKATPSFSSTPQSSSGTSNGITIAVISPKFVVEGSVMDVKNEIFKIFKKSIEADFMELLTARGYSVRGPFASRDEMVFDDKERCHIALIADVSPNFKSNTGGFVNVFSKCPNGYQAQQLKGDLVVYGDIALTVLEPITGEKLWAKKVEIPEESSGEVKSKVICGGSTNFEKFLYLIDNDNNVGNAVTTLLQKTYSPILNKIENHMNPSEFNRLMPQIEKLKKR